MSPPPTGGWMLPPETFRARQRAESPQLADTPQSAGSPRLVLSLVWARTCALIMRLSHAQNRHTEHKPGHIAQLRETASRKLFPK
eukprot:3128257-Amphidinium_carterae.1